ncbi:MAG: PaaI family thioesterase [Candidatus Dormiibacterota bacterium]
MPLLSDLQEVCDQSPIHRELGLRVKKLSGDTVLVTQLDSKWANSSEGDAIHGGVIGLLLDAAATLALIAATGDDWTTVDLRIDFLHALGLGPIEARGLVLHAGRSLGRAQATVVDADDRACAVAIGTFHHGPPLLRRPVSE